MSTPITRREFAEVLAAGRMVARSLELQRLLREAGYVRRDGISSAGIRLVSTLAKQHGLRDWPHTRDIADYDALIDVVMAHLASGEYQKFVSEIVPHCQCRANNCPCEGVLAGGPCDQVQEQSPLESDDDE